MPSPGFSTRAIHAGQPPDPATGAVNVPIYASSTYAQPALGENKGYEYSRAANPTRTALESNLASLEGGAGAAAFASGMAAIAGVLGTLAAGDHVVCGANVYGGTRRFFDRLLARQGLSFSYVDTRDAAAVARAFRNETRLLWTESPTNPLMELCDLREMARLAHTAGAALAVDNTFMSPYFQRPIELGADFVVHSTTKYLNGHSDGLGGAVVAARPDQIEAVRFVQKAAGAILSPFECFLVLRGIKTLAVRMRQHDASGRRVAAFLAAHPKVRAVYYPGLPSHPQHELACRQMSGFGGMVAFETGGLAQARAVLARLRVAALGESLGGVETLVSHPATMSHVGISAAERAAMGVTDGLVRVSVGLEDVEDIEADLAQALDAI
ncbi:MAG TPA: PLP-dependent aspartate aminotransferase family protein [Terriglobales bacterium]|nr:PLP-dependent aspartate aminotransferase family protein [Terriglobales bacterium]